MSTRGTETEKWVGGVIRCTGCGCQKASAERCPRCRTLTMVPMANVEAHEAVERAAREAATAIADLEDAHHVTRMEWFEARGIDLHASLTDALQALDDVRGQ